MAKKPGRKRIYAEPMFPYCIRYTATQMRKARRIGEGNMGAGARKAIDEYPEEKIKPFRSPGDE